MKSWKQYPNLFANGKFDIRVDSDAFDDTCDPVQFIRISNLYKEKFLTLMARKIEDMTDEELVKIKSLEPDIHPYQKDNAIIALVGRIGIMRFKTVEYLLSIGVYPFDQSHFETGEVIDINEVLNEK